MKPRRSAKPWLLALGLLLIGTVALGPSSSVAATDTPGASPKERRLRSEFGLSTSAQTLAEAHAQADSQDDFLGIPLTRWESLDIALRGEVASDLAKVTDRIAKLSTYGGVSIDQRSGGVVHEYYVGSPEAFDADISNAVRSRAPIVRVPVARSYRDLQEQFDSLDPNDERLISAGIKVVSVNLDVDINSLRLELIAEPSEAQLVVLKRVAPETVISVVDAEIAPAASVG